MNLESTSEMGEHILKRLYLYVINELDKNYQPRISSPNDGMSGPNVVDDLITLGTCKPRIRSSVKRDLCKWDTYIMGLSPSRTSPRRVIYLLHVAESITFAKAWRRGDRNEKYKLKRGGHSPLTDNPTRVRMNGDIIVRTFDGYTYKHIEGVHEKDWSKYVLGGKKVGSARDIYLVGDSKTSHYFDDKGPLVSNDFLNRRWKGFPNMRDHRIFYGREAEEILSELNLL